MMKAHTLLPAAIALALMTGVAQGAEPLALRLKPLAFLAGHCYKGTLAGGKDTDEHCFTPAYGGQVLRDVHTVHGPEHPDYVGETTYYWDPEARRIEYLYVENAGGIMRGTVEPGDDVIVFPATRYSVGIQSMTLRVHWALQGDGYEAWSEVQDTHDKDTWATMFRVRMAKSR